MKKKIFLLSLSAAVCITTSAQIKPMAASKTTAIPKTTNTNAVVSSQPVTPVQNQAVLKNAPTMITSAHSVSGVIPAEGPRATSITISGQKFGNVASDVQVKINGVSAIVTGVSDNQIACTVPDKAGSGPVSVAVKGKWATGGYFQYDWAVSMTTLAGGRGGGSFADGTGSSAAFNNPTGIALDGRGSIYVADRYNHRIRKINNFGEVTTLAGGGTQGYADGMGAAAKFNYPVGVAVDAAGNIYVADKENNRVRKISPAGMVTTLAGSGSQGVNDGMGAAAGLGYMGAIAIDPTNGNVYVATGSLIRKITPAGAVSTIAGVSRWNNQLTGAALSVSFLNPQGILVSSSHDIYVVDGTNLIRKISALGMVSTIAGDGKPGLTDGYGAAARFQGLAGIAMDAAGNLYVTQSGSNYDGGAMASCIRKIYRDGNVTTPTGQANLLSQPAGIVVDATGSMIIADVAHHCVQKIALQ
jgi:hypothetical protein